MKKCSVAELHMTATEGKVIKLYILKKATYQNCNSYISRKIILLDGLEANMKRFSDSSGLHFVIHLIYNNRYKGCFNVAHRDINTLLPSPHLKATLSS